MRPAHALVRPTHALKMKDLERATGVGRETIRFYIREGLLPEPQRPGRNVAWYDAGFVERVRLIKDLQQKRFLPLHAIKAILGTADGAEQPSRSEVQTLLELDGKLFPPMAGGPAAPPERLAALAARTGLPVAEIERIAEAGAIAVVRRDGDRWVEDDAIRIVELWGKMRQAGYSEALGFEPGQIELYVEFVQALARQELRIFTQGIAGRVATEDARRMAEDGIVLLNQLIALLRKQTLLRYIAEGNVPPEGRTPSEEPARRPTRPRRR
jgi:DNA-binding transcriptional MerR regulator